ncbi:hypothetical protein FACS189419_09050 [Planctomycetales bacterium]|nr:hypothetical protein FACS189419_09050 [Planctomycetales bacterium]
MTLITLKCPHTTFYTEYTYNACKPGVKEAVRRLVEGDGDARMQKIRRELKKKDRVIAENQRALAEKEKQIAELKAKLSVAKRNSKLC